MLMFNGHVMDARVYVTEKGVTAGGAVTLQFTGQPPEGFHELNHGTPVIAVLVLGDGEKEVVVGAITNKRPQGKPAPVLRLIGGGDGDQD